MLHIYTIVIIIHFIRTYIIYVYSNKDFFLSYNFRCSFSLFLYEHNDFMSSFLFTNNIQMNPFDWLPQTRVVQSVAFQRSHQSHWLGTLTMRQESINAHVTTFFLYKSFRSRLQNAFIHAYLSEKSDLSENLTRKK